MRLPRWSNYLAKYLLLGSSYPARRTFSLHSNCGIVRQVLTLLLALKSHGSALTYKRRVLNDTSEAVRPHMSK